MLNRRLIWKDFMLSLIDVALSFGNVILNPQVFHIVWSLAFDSIYLEFLHESLLCFDNFSQGSEKLLQLVSDSSNTSNTYTDKKEPEHKDSKNERHSSQEPYWVSIHIQLCFGIN